MHFINAVAGGVYDAPITSLAFDRLGWLFVGTMSCVDILFPNSTVNHLTRFQGLPYNETTSVSIEYNTRLYLLLSLSHGLFFSYTSNTCLPFD